MIFENENASILIVCKLEFVGIKTFLRLLQSENAFSHIFVTLGGIEISLIVERENVYFSIVCKLEFIGIEFFIRFLQL